MIKKTGKSGRDQERSPCVHLLCMFLLCQNPRSSLLRWQVLLCSEVGIAQRLRIIRSAPRTQSLECQAQRTFDGITRISGARPARARSTYPCETCCQYSRHCDKHFTLRPSEPPNAIAMFGTIGTLGRLELSDEDKLARIGLFGRLMLQGTHALRT